MAKVTSKIAVNDSRVLTQSVENRPPNESISHLRQASTIKGALVHWERCSASTIAAYLLRKLHVLSTHHAAVVSKPFHQGSMWSSTDYWEDVIGITARTRYDASIREVTMLRGFMGAFDIKPDKMAFATSVANGASIGTDLQPRKNLLERLLSVVCDVRPGEGLGALLLTINLFTLLGAYYLLKTVRESLILAERGAEVKAYSSAAQAIILLGVVPLYGWITTQLNRNRLLRWTTLFFASNLLFFYSVGQAGTRIGVVYYVLDRGSSMSSPWLNSGLLRQTSFLWSKAKDCSRYSALERRLERSQGLGLQDN